MISPPAGGSSAPGLDTCLRGRLQYRQPRRRHRAGGPKGEGHLLAMLLAVRERAVSLGEKRRDDAGLSGRGRGGQWGCGGQSCPPGMAREEAGKLSRAIPAPGLMCTGTKQIPLSIPPCFFLYLTPPNIW